jgi:DNA-binding NarL/FixJ family response regulator
MSTIGIIDDRQDLRTTMRKRVEMELRKLEVPWDVIDSAPLSSVNEYPQWIRENEISILLLDEKLKEQPSNGIFSNHNGHDLVKKVREGYKELPIFIITAYDEEADVENNAGDYDSVIHKDSFGERSSEYVKRFIRATNKYLKNNESEFQRLTELSQKIALGLAVQSENDEAKSLQTKLEIPYTIDIVNDREKATKNLENELDSLEDLNRKVEEYLKNKNQ